MPPPTTILVSSLSDFYFIGAIGGTRVPRQALRNPLCLPLLHSLHPHDAYADLQLQLNHHDEDVRYHVMMNTTALRRQTPSPILQQTTSFKEEDTRPATEARLEERFCRHSHASYIPTARTDSDCASLWRAPSP